MPPPFRQQDAVSPPGALADAGSGDGPAPPVTARLLLLSGGLGGGHHALAAACAAALAPLGLASDTVDCMALLGDRQGRLGRWAFRRLLASPGYDAVHFAVLREGRPAARWADRAAGRRLEPALTAHLGGGIVDVALPVFATGVSPACRLKAAGRCRRVVTFLPDALAHAMWVDDGVDLFLVTSEAAAASVRRYRPRAAVRVVDMPLPEGFTAPLDAAAARRDLRVPPEAPCVLVMAGAWGMAPVDRIAADLAADGTWVLAVAGTDPELLRRLTEVAAAHPTVRAVGWTDQIPALMAASDVVVTTPGMTCHEARAVGRPLVLLDVVPGHGRDNLHYELSRGHAAVSGPDPAGVAGNVRALLDAPGRSRPPRLPNQAARDLAAALADLGVPAP